MEEEQIYTLYMHKNKVNNKKYIGITKQNPPSRRWANGKGYTKNPFFNAAIEKYGWEDGFEHIIIEDKLTQEEACIKEKEFISIFDTTNPEKGYNLSDGGIHLGPTSFEKMTEWANNNKRFGEDNVNSKKIRCIETGDVFGSIEEAVRWCDSTKVGECCRGHRKHAGVHPETGIKLSWEYADENELVTIYCHEKTINKKKKIAHYNDFKVLCIETNEIFDSETQACEAYKAAKGTIGRACNGKRKTALGKHWQWIKKGDIINDKRS